MRLTSVLIAALFVAATPAASADDDGPRTPEEIRVWLSTPPAARPELPDDVAAGVAELEEEIGEFREAEAFEEAIALAEEVLEIRRKRQSGWTSAAGTPVQWWEIGDAQRRIADLRTWAALSADDRNALRAADQDNTRAAELNQRGAYSEALDLKERQIAVRRRVLGDDHPDTLTSINGMAFLLQARGRLAEAEPYYREALEGRRRVLGDDHPETLISINNLGRLLNGQGKLAEAEPYYRESLEGRRRVLGDDHPATLISINNMGFLLEAQGKRAEAEPYFREAVERGRRVLGDDHPSTLTFINNMGFLLQAQGKLAEAQPYYREALEGDRRVLGDDHSDTLNSMNNMGFLLKAQGKLPEAETYYRDALEGMRRVLGDDHPDTLTSINNMGRLLLAQGKLAEAETYHHEALEGRRRVLRDDHPATLISINNMGTLLAAQGKHAEAEPYFSEALEGRRRVLGNDHPATLISINNMGYLLDAQGELAEAEPYFREALEGKRRVLGDDHPDTLNSINNMGALLQAQGKLAEAEPYYREALEGGRRVLGDDHPDTLPSINNMGSLLQSQGRLAEAARYYGEALEGRRRVLGDDHPDTLNSIKNMGRLLQTQGKLPEAERYCREALDRAERLRGLATGGERGRAAMAGKVRLHRIAGDLVTLLVRTDRSDQAWTVAERGRSRALLDLLARSEQGLVGLASDPARFEAVQAAERDARVRLTTTEARLAALRKERESIATVDGLDDVDRTTRLVSFDEAIEAQHERILDARRDLAEATAHVFLELRSVMPDAQPMAAEAINADLRPREVMLDYVWTEDAVALLTASGNAGMTGTIIADGRDAVTALADEVVTVRTAMAVRPQSDWTSAARNAAARLAGRLLPDTVRSAIAGATRVVILPDGPLTGLPLEALAFDSGAALLDDERVQIAYASSATVYLNRRDARGGAPSGTASLVALGDPVFDRDAPPEPDYPVVGILVTRAVDGGNAANAGIARGDVLLSYAGTDVRDYDHLLELKAAASAAVEAGTRSADDALPVRYWRGGDARETTMTPGSFGVYLDRGSPDRGLRAMAEASRGMDERIAEASMLDLVRLHGGSLPRLPGSRVEVERIGAVAAAAGAQPTTLTGADATLANLEHAVSGARYLHLASHGLTGSVDRPYDASLALTMPETPTADDLGFLTLDHLIRTWRGKLDACDLVVLSACDTQRGVRTGNSLMALPWGFFFAGAPTVVASLWRIDDEATALLMSRFYENLLGAHAGERTIRGTDYGDGDSMPKADALQEAKRWLRTYEVEDRGSVRLRRGQAIEKRRPYEHPYYWAAFVLIGDPG